MKLTERQRREERQQTADLLEQLAAMTRGRDEALDELRQTLDSDRPAARDSGDSFDAPPASLSAAAGH